MFRNETNTTRLTSFKPQIVILWVTRV